MIARRPEPGSPWARHCPTSFPREWLAGADELPAGFTRPATADESDLITGRMSEAEFRRRSKNRPPSSHTVRPSKRTGRPNPVVRKVLGWNRFLDALARREPRLHPLAVALWCWLWKCERQGFARTSERKLAERFGVGRGSVRARVRELTAAGFLSVARLGKHNRSSTIYRVRPTPKLAKA